MKKTLALFAALIATPAAAQMSCLNDVCSFGSPLTLGSTLKISSLTGFLYANGSGSDVSVFTYTGTGTVVALATGPTLTNSTNNPGATFVSDQSTAGGAQQILIKGASNANQQLLFGYNTSSDYANVQAILQGTGYKPTFISPAGGGAGVGVTALTGSDLFMVGGQIGATGYRAGASVGVTCGSGLGGTSRTVNGIVTTC